VLPMAREAAERVVLAPAGYHTSLAHRSLSSQFDNSAMSVSEAPNREVTRSLQSTAASQFFFTSHKKSRSSFNQPIGSN
jgi:hypothetical protein